MYKKKINLYFIKEEKTMRNLKKLFAIGLSTVMLMSSSIMAFAGNTDFSGKVETSKNISDWQAEDNNFFEVSDVAIQTGSAADEWKMTSGETGKATLVFRAVRL